MLLTTETSWAKYCVRFSCDWRELIRIRQNEKIVNMYVWKYVQKQPQIS